MKNNIKKVAAVFSFAVVGVVSYSTYSNYNSNIPDDDLLSENVLALADGPIAQVPKYKCYNSITESKGASVLLCATCTQVPDAESTWWSGTGECND